ncbi:MAG: SHOCT domain-containing protein [Burkholderiaceae bacterium]|nr:SHOCT domain-containing protein [Burkholderiaceae bacterium]
MRHLAIVLIVAGLTFSNTAYAFFFFFIPGSAARSIADSITGAKGNICVKEGTQVGQILSSGNGNTAKVLSLSGTSSICPNPAQPIRAELEFTYNFSSKAGIDLSDDFKPSTLTDLEMFNGLLLKAISKNTKNHGIQISATTKKANLDIETMANNLERVSLNNQKLKDVSSARSEKLTINGMPAVRFEISGTLSGIFGQRVTYQYTVIEGDKEVVVVNVYAPVDYMELNRSELQKIAEQVSGLHSTEGVASTQVAPVSPPPVASSRTDSTQSASVPGEPNPIARDQSPPSPISTSSVSSTSSTPRVAVVPEDKTVSVKQRLQTLNTLLKDGLITQSEFNAKKQEILNGL